MKRITDRLADTVVAGGYAIVFGLTLAYLVMAPPSEDDFCRAELDLSGFADAVGFAAFQYQEWSGRWLAMFIHGWVLPSVDPTSPIYPVLSASSLVIWLLSSYLALDLLYRSGMPARTKWLMAGAFTGLFVALTPSPGQGVYWFTGIVENTAPILTITACLWLALAPRTGPAWRQAGRLIAASALAIATGGLHEFSGLILIGILTAGVAACLWRRDYKSAGALGIVLAAALIGTAISMLAPGNATRGARYPNAHDFGFALSLVLRRVQLWPSTWLLTPALLCLTALLLSSPVFLRAHSAWRAALLERPYWPAAIMITTIAACFAAFFAYAYAVGELPQGRVWNTIWAIFMFGWLMLVVSVGARLDAEQIAASPIAQNVRRVAALLFALSLVFSANTLTAATELGETAAWRTQLEAREALIRTQVAQGARDIVFAPLGFTPSMYYWFDVSEDPSVWVNGCLARFYEVDTVRVAPAQDRNAVPEM